MCYAIFFNFNIILPYICIQNGSSISPEMDIRKAWVHGSRVPCVRSHVLEIKYNLE